MLLGKIVQLLYQLMIRNSTCYWIHNSYQLYYSQVCTSLSVYWLMVQVASLTDDSDYIRSDYYAILTHE